MVSDTRREEWTDTGSQGHAQGQWQGHRKSGLEQEGGETMMIPTQE